jgi:hypothetical protein
MPLDPTENLKRVSVQLSDEQIAWLKDRARRLSTRSLAQAVRNVVDAAMDAEQQEESAA